MRLVIGNKCYSSWSMRPWLVLDAFAIPFEEVVIPLDTPETPALRAAHAPSPTVPILVDGPVAIWESVAIIEYLAETFPDRAIWPTDRVARAEARVLACEMAAGYTAVRGACHMNFGRRFARRDRGAAVAADVARVDARLADVRARWGGGGDFLFGAFSAADAMYAPMAARFWGYDLPRSEVTGAYFDALLAHPSAEKWIAAGRAETWVVTADEVDEPAIEEFRPQL